MEHMEDFMVSHDGVMLVGFALGSSEAHRRLHGKS